MFRFDTSAWVSLLLALLALGCGRTGFSDSADGGSNAGNDGGSAIEGDAGQTVDAGRPQTHRLTILTINLLHDFPKFSNLDFRTDMVAEFIKQRKPDMVAAQEVGESSTIKNRCKVIGEKAGYDYRWVSEGGIPSIFAEGPCVLSRWPVIDSQFVDLPHPQQSGLVVRKALGVRVQWTQGPLTLISTHFSNGSNAANDRTDQAVKAYGLVREYAGALPVFMAGDFNSTPETAAMKFLRGEQTVEGVAGTMLDAWQRARPQDDGFTASSSMPSRRIDYVYVDPAATGSVRVVNCETVLSEPSNGIYASDHLGVLCEFEVTVVAN